MPYDKVEPGEGICEFCVLTVLLAKDNLMKYYEGRIEFNPVIGETSFGNDGFRNIILQKGKAVKNVTGSADDFVMIIKLSDESTFQNFVNIVDEVAINNVKPYYTSGIDKNDLKNLHPLPKQ